jgi:hypothetical protein
MPPLATDRGSNPPGDRGAIDRHAVRAVGDLLMLGAWLERRARSVSTNIQKGRP